MGARGDKIPHNVTTAVAVSVLQKTLGLKSKKSQ